MKAQTLKLLLNQRKAQTEYVSKELGELRKQLERISKQIETLNAYLTDVRRKSSEKASKGIFGDQIKNQLGFTQKIQDGIRQQVHKKDILENQIENMIRKWNECIIEERKVEKLIEKVNYATAKEQENIEQKMNDEFSQRFYLARAISK